MRSAIEIENKDVPRARSMRLRSEVYAWLQGLMLAKIAEQRQITFRLHLKRFCAARQTLEAAGCAQQLKSKNNLKLCASALTSPITHNVDHGRSEAKCAHGSKRWYWPASLNNGESRFGCTQNASAI